MIIEFGRAEALTEFRGDIDTLLLTCVVQHIGHLIGPSDLEFRD